MFVLRKTKGLPLTGRKLRKPPKPQELKDADKERQVSLASSLQKREWNSTVTGLNALLCIVGRGRERLDRLPGNFFSA